MARPMGVDLVIKTNRGRREAGVLVDLEGEVALLISDRGSPGRFRAPLASLLYARSRGAHRVVCQGQDFLATAPIMDFLGLGTLGQGPDGDGFVLARGSLTPREGPVPQWARTRKPLELEPARIAAKVPPPPCPPEGKQLRLESFL